MAEAVGGDLLVDALVDRDMLDLDDELLRLPG